MEKRAYFPFRSLMILVSGILIVLTAALPAFAGPPSPEPGSVSSRGEILDEEGMLFNQLEKIDLSGLQSEVDRINREIEGYLPEINLKELLLGFLKGELEFSWGGFFRSILRYLGNEVTANIHLLGQIIILVVFGAILSIFHNSFSSQTISNTANLLIFLILAVMLLKAFQLAVGISIEAVNNMVSFMQALLPILLSLLVSTGAFTSAVVFHPLTFLIITGLSTAIKYIIFPMIFISAVMSIVTNLNEQYSLSRLAALFKEFSLGLLSLIMVLFVGGLLIQGGAAAVTDSLSLRTAKYLTGTFIPVIGGIFSDAVDLIVSCSLIIKNALNLFAVLAILIIIAYPLLKIVSLIIIYKLAGAMVQPIADPRVVNIINDLGNGLILTFLILCTVSLMFFIVLAVIVGTANLTVMMR